MSADGTGFDFHELVIDSFAGGGGASTGIELALERPVDVAINHDGAALAMHEANHPTTRHVREDVWNVDPEAIMGKRQVGLLWASPDCKHFSKAKGGKPVEKKIRGLAWVICRWAKAVRPRVIAMENVEEFRDWGPLKLIDGAWYPDPERKGITFNRFVTRLRNLGYVVEHRELRACDFGAPTIRKRFFLIARRDGRPIVWPQPTHGKGTGVPYRTAAECIDWSIPCPSIFERKKPLAEATLRRIARGIQRYVIDAAQPFIVPMQHQNRPTSIDEPVQTVTTQGNKFGLVVPLLQHATHGGRDQDLGAPVPTVTGAHRGEMQLVAAALTKFSENSTGQVPDGPLHTVMAGAPRHGLVAAALAHIGNGERVGQAPRAMDIEKPLGTVVGCGQKHALVTAFLAQHNNHRGTEPNAGHDARKPFSTISAKGCQQQVVNATLFGPYPEYMKPLPGEGRDAYWQRQNEHDDFGRAARVSSFLIHYYSSGGQHSAPSQPMPTVPANDRIGLVMVHGEPYQIVDIGMRMLTPRELARAQGFPDSYIIDRGADGKPLTKTAQVRMIGNSVCPPVAAAIVRANFVHETKVRRAA